MKLLRSATLSVADLDRSIATYSDWLDYELIEESVLGTTLAQHFQAPQSAAQRMAVMRPASGADIFLRFVENDRHPDYQPLRTYGWAAIEICVSDVLAANERMLEAPMFEIIGPPREIEGLDAIYPMQMKGPDGEIVYLTQIRDDLPAFDLPRATSLIDHLFILVMANRDLPAALQWMKRYTGMDIGREAMEIVYTMLANAFDLPHEELHTIATMIHGRDVFLELDQYPAAATERPCHPGKLSPGIAVGSFLHPDFDDLAANAGDVATGPIYEAQGAIYGGQPAITIRNPDGALIELIKHAG